MVDNTNRCPGCMGENGGLTTCPRCGWMLGGAAELPHHLKPGLVLQDKYLVGKVLGQGGFGITYLAWDLNLDLKLAIKEFYPQGLVSRMPGQSEVSAYSGTMKNQYAFGLDRFLSEAKTLARFSDHPNIVSVRDFFRSNGTAYMVMNYVEGVTFEEYLKQKGGKIDYAQALAIMMPVLDALREVHQAGIMHRDISPDNIFIDTLGRVMLIDFGAARLEMQQKNRSLSVIMKAGYSPEEQYRTRGEQGPWTDIYALAATFYRAITGVTPAESLDRLAEDILEPPSALGVPIDKTQEAVLLKALAIKAQDRYRNVESFLMAVQGIGSDAAQERVDVSQAADHADNVDPSNVNTESSFSDDITAKQLDLASDADQNITRVRTVNYVILAAIIFLASALVIMIGASYVRSYLGDMLAENTLASSEGNNNSTQESDSDLGGRLTNLAFEVLYFVFKNQVGEIEDKYATLYADNPSDADESLSFSTYVIDDEFGTTRLGDLDIGDRIYDPSWEWVFRTGKDYSGDGDTKPVIWIVVAKDHYKGFNSHVTLLADELIAFYPFDDGDYTENGIGSNEWLRRETANAKKGLRLWLNSSGLYLSTGFYNAISDEFKEKIIRTLVPNRYQQRSGMSFNTNDWIFIPSTTELGGTRSSDTYVIGEVYPYFEEASNLSRIGAFNDAEMSYWTRSPYVADQDGSSVCYVNAEGSFDNVNATQSDIAVRPVLNMKADVLVSPIE